VGFLLSQASPIREFQHTHAAWISAAFHLKGLRVFLAASAPSHQATPKPIGSEIIAALCVPGPGCYTVYVTDNGSTTVKSLNGRSGIDADGAGKLRADMAHMSAA
jgi:hypothetical protein